MSGFNFGSGANSNKYDDLFASVSATSTLSNNNNNNNPFNSGGACNNNSNVPNFNFPANNASNLTVNASNNPNGDNPMKHIERIYQQYNAQHPLCRFETVLYNKIPSTMNANCFEKPPLIRSQVWDQGIKQNPDHRKFVPVGIRGYNELNQRSNLCLAGHCSTIKRFQEISEKINELKDQINIRTKQTIVDLKQSQTHLSHRLLVILRNYVCKMSAAQSHGANLSEISLHSLSGKEMKLKNVLAQMNEESKQLAHLFGHISKLSANFGQNSMLSHNGSDSGDGELGKHYLNNNADHMDPANMKQMFCFLKQQQQFVQLLAKTVQNDVKDLNVISRVNNNHPIY